MNSFSQIIIIVINYVLMTLEIIKTWFIHLKESLEHRVDDPNNIFHNRPYFKNIFVSNSKITSSELPNYMDSEYCAFVWQLAEKNTKWKPLWANKKVLKSFNRSTLNEFLEADFSEISQQLLETLENIVVDCENGKFSYDSFFQYPNGVPEYISLVSMPIEMKGYDTPVILSFYVAIDLQICDEDKIFLADNKIYGSKCITVYDENLKLLMKNTLSRTKHRKLKFPDDTLAQHGICVKETEIIKNKVKDAKFGSKLCEKEVRNIKNMDEKIYNVEVYLIRNPNNGNKAVLVVETDITKISKISSGLVNVFHELRVALTGIVGAIELLKSKNFSTENEKLLETAENSTTVLSSILDDMLDFSKLRSVDEFPIYLAPVTPIVLFEELDKLIESFAPMIYKKELNFFIDYPLILINQKELIFNIDLKRIRQVLSNFILNSKKFTDKGLVQISLLVESNQLIFNVKDTGRGIPSEKIPTLFDPFAQFHTKESNEGTGIGLTIANDLVKKMKGKIEVKSTVGFGSEFIITIPIEPEIHFQPCPFIKFNKVSLILDRSFDKNVQIMTIIDQLCENFELLDIDADAPEVDFGMYDLVICDTSVVKKQEFLSKLKKKNTLILYKINEEFDGPWKDFRKLMLPVKPYLMYKELKKLFLEEIAVIERRNHEYLLVGCEEHSGFIKLLKEFGQVDVQSKLSDYPPKKYNVIFIMGDTDEKMQEIINNPKLIKNTTFVRVAKNFQQLASESKKFLKFGFDDILLPTRQNVKKLIEKWDYDQDVSHFLDGVKIILAEDNKINIFLLKRLLEKFGDTKITLVESAEELIEKFDDHCMIFSDQNMLKLTGLEAANKIKMKAGTDTIPFILVSGEYVGHEILIKSKVDDFILKPVTFQDLKRVLIKFRHWYKPEDKPFHK